MQQINPGNWSRYDDKKLRPFFAQLIAKRFWLSWVCLGVVWMIFPTAVFAQAVDKSGVKPQVIALPTGPGSLTGLGESFEPNLSTGTASYAVRLETAPGRAGFQPALTLLYNGGNANGPWGLGWRLDIPAIQRRTDAGLPTYDDAQDQFIFSNGEKLVALSNGDYRFENESSFLRFRRLAGGGWEAHQPDGVRLIFGESAPARESNPYGVFRWRLEGQIDPHGNEIHYVYEQDGGYAYLTAIRYNAAANGRGQAVRLFYEPRPDSFTDRTSRAPITVAKRGKEIRIESLGKLVRAYHFDYTSSHPTVHSLLHTVTQVGNDEASSLPPTTFTYTGFITTTYTVVAMQNPPPVGLLNPDVDLADINADALPDLVYTLADGHRFYLNRGHGRWQAEPVIPVQSPPDRLSSPNARLADMDGDGRVDLLVKAGATAGAPFYYYTHTASGWDPTHRLDYPRSPAFALADPNVQLVDANNDKRIDVVLTTASQLLIWLARDGAWSATADFSAPLPATGTPLRFGDPHAKLGDLTGDGLQDFVLAHDGQITYWAHNGLGDYAAGVQLLNPPRGLGEDAARLLLGDLNNDGLDDLVLPGNRQVYYWLNLGNDRYSDPVVLDQTPAFDAGDTAVRLADMDGDGMVELLYSRYPTDAAMHYVDFSPGAQPFLLASIANGLGRTIRIDYQPSTYFSVADWDAGQPWTTMLPFPVQLVSRVTVHDANSDAAYVTDYRYADGYYDGGEKEFRGFARAQSIQHGDESATTTVNRLYYDTGRTDESRKGLLLQSEVLTVGGECAGSFSGCLARTVNQLTTRLLHAEGAGRQVAYSFVSQTDRLLHEGESTPAHLRQRFERDEFGNLTQTLDDGQICAGDPACGDDERYQYSDYAYNLSAWIVNRPQRTYQTDENGLFASEIRYYYDGEAYEGLPLGQVARGDLTRQEARLGPLGARFVQLKRQAFDAYGNIVGMLDGNGNRTLIEYDALFHTFPVVERLALGDGRSLVVAATYDLGLGKATAVTDYNGHVALFAYDQLGRLTKIVQPGDTLALPTQRFFYELGSPRSAIRTEQRERSGEAGVLTTVAYFDGLGRKLQLRTEASGGQVAVSEAVRFNARGGVQASYLPYFAPGLAYAAPDPTLPHSTQSYDALGRAIRTGNADGTYTATVYRPLARLLYDEADNTPGSPHAGTPKTQRYDGLDRLIEVEEINVVAGQRQHYTTRYAYDVLGNLVEVIDAQGNRKRQRFDWLSRRVEMADPDSGLTRYAYDDVGNLLTRTDAKGQTIHYRYDAANRLLEERWSYPDGRTLVNARYHYDADLELGEEQGENLLGRLAAVSDQVGVIHYSYDPRGNIAGLSRTFAGEGLVFVTRTDYDAMNRVVRQVYPNGYAVSQEYDERGLLHRIPGYVEAIRYGAAGQRSDIAYPNGVATRYDYDQRLRLTALATTVGAQTLQALGYRYDETSNVTAITDARGEPRVESNQTQHFAYDALYRLVTAQGVYGQIDYGYDAIGNLVSKTSSTDSGQQMGELRYGENGAGPHTLTSAGEVALQYDANGNQIRKGAAAYTWDARNQLAGMTHGDLAATFRYDANGSRTHQRLEQDGVVTTTLYVGNGVEVRNGELILSIFDGDQRLAQAIFPFQPAGLITGFVDAGPPAPPVPLRRQWIVSDHLGGAQLLVDEAGQVMAETFYYPYGETRAARNAGAIHYGYTGKELDATGLHYFGARYYDSSIGRFLSADPLYVEQPQRALENPQFFNLYVYAHNSPLNYVDPDGHDPVRGAYYLWKAFWLKQDIELVNTALTSYYDARATGKMPKHTPYDVLKSPLDSDQMVVGTLMAMFGKMDRDHALVMNYGKLSPAERRQQQIARLTLWRAQSLRDLRRLSVQLTQSMQRAENLADDLRDERDGIEAALALPDLTPNDASTLNADLAEVENQIVAADRRYSTLEAVRTDVHTLIGRLEQADVTKIVDSVK
jgi:RHS repeat-associated protein